METDDLPTPDNVIFGKIQVLLAEKRTALAALPRESPCSRVASLLARSPLPIAALPSMSLFQKAQFDLSVCASTRSHPRGLTLITRTAPCLRQLP